MKILFIPLTSSSLAHTIRCFSIADIMKECGHEVFFTSCNSKKEFIKKNGYKVVETYKSVNINDPKDQSVNFLETHRQDYVKEIKAEVKATKSIKPDLIIMAPALFGPYLYYATKIPTIAVMDVQYLGDYAKGLMGISLATTSFKHRILRLILRPIFDKTFVHQYLSEINEIYNQCNLPSNFKTRKELYEKMAVLIPGDKITQPLRKDSSNILHIGSLFWNGFDKIETDLTDKEILRFKNKHKLIYLTFGGSIFKKSTYLKLLKLAKGLNYHFIISLGPNFDRKEFPVDDSHTIIRNLVPGLRVAKYADIVINTGSQGSVGQALQYGKPQICFPTIMDQAYYANRVEELKVGININKISILKFSKRESFSHLPNDIELRILKAIEKILNNPSYARNAKDLMKKINRDSNNSKKIVQFLENYVKNNDI